MVAKPELNLPPVNSKTILIKVINFKIGSGRFVSYSFSGLSLCCLSSHHLSFPSTSSLPHPLSFIFLFLVWPIFLSPLHLSFMSVFWGWGLSLCQPAQYFPCEKWLIQCVNWPIPDDLNFKSPFILGSQTPTKGHPNTHMLVSNLSWVPNQTNTVS